MNSPFSPLPALRAEAGPVVVRNYPIPERGGVSAIMSHIRRRGEWTLPRFFRVLNVMGHVELDLTDIRIGQGTSEIAIESFLGAVEIHVPGTVRVECNGDGLVGEFTIKGHASTSTYPGVPLIRITGSSFMGSVVVTVD